MTVSPPGQQPAAETQDQPAASGILKHALQEHRVHAYKCHTPHGATTSPGNKPCAPRPSVTRWCDQPDQRHFPITAALVTDQPQHLLRIHDLLPGFASSFASRHFGSVDLLPVGERNGTDPWGDSERQEGEVNQVKRSSASPPR